MSTSSVSRSKKNDRANSPGDIKRRRAVVLIIVMVVTTMLALSAYAFSEVMFSHYEAVRLSGRRIQARSLVDSGVDAVRSYLLLDEATRQTSGGHYDNPDQFQMRLVVEDDDPFYQGAFTVLAAAVDQEGAVAGVRYGLEDESSRLNLNALLVLDNAVSGAGRQLLMGLPGMTEDVADAILDWLDADDEPRDFGAEFDYYAAIDPPYAPANGPLKTVEELLLIRGVTPQFLFGLDVNRNGMVDAHETQSGAIAGEGGVSERGWSAYLTLYSKEANLNLEGEARIDINGDDLETLHADLTTALGDDWANFIIAYRQYGPYTGEDEPTGGLKEDLDLSQQGGTKLAHVLDLVGARVRIQEGGGQQDQGEGQQGQGQQSQGQGQGQGQGDEEEDPVILASPIQDGDYSTLADLMDKVTVFAEPMIPGRLNINTAPKEVIEGLQAIPGIDEQVTGAILSSRQIDPTAATGREHASWLLAEGVVNVDQMKALSPFITGGGDVYRAQIVGFYVGGGAAARTEIIFDASEGTPRIVLWRNLNHLGRGYPLDVLGVSAIAE